MIPSVFGLRCGGTNTVPPLLAQNGPVASLARSLARQGKAKRSSKTAENDLAASVCAAPCRQQKAFFLAQKRPTQLGSCNWPRARPAPRVCRVRITYIPACLPACVCAHARSHVPHSSPACCVGQRQPTPSQPPALDLPPPFHRLARESVAFVAERNTYAMCTVEQKRCHRRIRPSAAGSSSTEQPRSVCSSSLSRSVVWMSTFYTFASTNNSNQRRLPARQDAAGTERQAL